MDKQLQMEEEVKWLNNKIGMLENEIEQLRKEKINLNQRIAQLEEELNRLRLERKALQGNMGEQIQSLKKKLQEQ